jgi:hypothetical protein
LAYSFIDCGKVESVFTDIPRSPHILKKPQPVTVEAILNFGGDGGESNSTRNNTLLLSYLSNSIKIHKANGTEFVIKM